MGSMAVLELVNTELSSKSEGKIYLLWSIVHLVCAGCPASKGLSTAGCSFSRSLHLSTPGGHMRLAHWLCWLSMMPPAGAELPPPPLPHSRLAARPGRWQGWGPSTGTSPGSSQLGVLEGPASIVCISTPSFVKYLFLRVLMKIRFCVEKICGSYIVE